jgi:arylsulfatase A-like enzyme
VTRTHARVKGTLYEGGTRVCALANWPGHIKAGTVDEMIRLDWRPPDSLGA